jgi:hypothetical protein
VVKETYQSSTGDYLSLTISRRQTEVKKKNKKVEEIETQRPLLQAGRLVLLSCPHDDSARAWRMAGRQRLTVTELIHSAAALEKFEATGTTYQHAIQKIAVAQAADSETSVAQIVKQLNELCTTAIHRVYTRRQARRVSQSSARRVWFACGNVSEPVSIRGTC